jgi:pimeloyl-ACP methyl ester carboxylesterase
VRVANVVLVHGAFVDERCWERVASGLRECGHDVLAPRLHRGSLGLDTLAIQEVIDGVDGPVVVCGWSYGGLVITGLELPASSHLVYLCAVMPDTGDSMWSLAGEHLAGLRDEVDVRIEADDAGHLVASWDGDEIDALFWADAPPEIAAQARASIRPQVATTFFDPPQRVAWRTCPSTYVVGRHDRLFPGEVGARMAERAETQVEWDTSHSPNLSRPDLVVELLGSLSNAPG